MSADWVLINADLSYKNRRFASGGRLYFVKAGKKNVSVHEVAKRKNVRVKLSYIPKFYYDLSEGIKYLPLHKFPKKTWKNLAKQFREYTKKTAIEKSILDTLKKIIKLVD